MKKRILTVFLCAIFFCSAAFAAHCSAEEIDMEYEGVVEDDSVPTEDGANRTAIADGSAYDSQKGFYYYTVGSSEIGLSMPSSAVVTDYISFDIPDGLDAVLYRDGNKVDISGTDTVKEKGSYVFSFSGSESTRISFQIVSAVTGSVYEYRLPSGFDLESVTRDSQPVAFDSNVADMTEEGSYMIRYRCRKTDIPYTLSVTVDHTAPTLKLEAVTDGYANGPVDISDLESGCTVLITHNGEEMKYSKTLTSSGTYKIVLTDAAGNKSEYNFVIRVYFNTNGVLFVVILVLAAAVLCGYLIHYRKHIRVR